MSRITNAVIMLEEEDRVRAIFLDYLGDLDEAGRVLLDHYTDLEKVRALIELGDLAEVGPEIEPTGPHSFNKPEPGVTLAYRRDRGEGDTGPTIYDRAEDVGRTGCDVVYRFSKSFVQTGRSHIRSDLAVRKYYHWFVSLNQGRNWVALKHLIG